MKRKSIIVGLAISSMIFGAACSNESIDNEISEMGRYVETEFETPDGEDRILDIVKLSDDSLCILGQQGIYESDDDGQSWESIEELPSVYDSDLMDGQYIEAGAVDRNKNMFFAVQNYMTWEWKYIYVTAEGVEKELELEIPEPDWVEVQLQEMEDWQLYAYMEHIEESEVDETIEFSDEERSEYEKRFRIRNKPYFQDIKFTDEGTVFALQSNRTVINIVDTENGKINGIYGGMDNYTVLYDFAVLDDSLYVVGTEGIQTYDIQSGNLVSTDEKLRDYTMADFGQESHRENVSVQYDTNETEVILLPNEAEKEFYLCDMTGVYRYKKEEGMELIIDGAFNSISDYGILLSNLVMKGEEEFLLVGTDELGTKLLNYEFSEEVSSVPENILKVYMMEYSPNIKQAANLFQARNPEYYIDIEVGMTGEDAVTASDAVRILNTNIMAGNGPDVIVLDGLGKEAYMEKGILMDLSDIVEQLSSKGDYFEAILRSGNEGEEIYSLSTRFLVPVLFGETEIVADIEDIEDLADAAEWLEERDGRESPVFINYTLNEWVELMASMSGGTFIKVDGTIDKEALSWFLTQVKRIYGVGQRTKEETEHIIGGGYIEGSFQTNSMILLGGEQKMDIVKMGSIRDFDIMKALGEYKSWTYQLFEGTDGKNFIPVENVAVSSKSENQEKSKEFIKLLLQMDIQKLIVSAGFPVNIESYDYLWRKEVEEPYNYGYAMGAGDGAILMVDPGEEEDYLHLKEEIQSLVQVVDLDQIVLEAISKEMKGFVEDNTSLEQTTENIMKSINLYLAE